MALRKRVMKVKSETVTCCGGTRTEHVEIEDCVNGAVGQTQRNSIEIIVDKAPFDRSVGMRFVSAFIATMIAILGFPRHFTKKSNVCLARREKDLQKERGSLPIDSAEFL